MKALIGTVLPAIVICLVSGCVGTDQPGHPPRREAARPAVATVLPAAKPQSAAHHSSEAAAPLSRIDGTVVQTLSAGRYVYLEISTGTGTGTTWVAAPETSVARGDKVTCTPELVMEQYASPSLKRTFERVFFVGSLNNLSGVGTMPSNHPSIEAASGGRGSKPIAITTPLERPAGGTTIAEITSRSGELAGTEVVLRAKVIKYNADILGANWLRVKDAPGGRDLAVTTKSEANPGDTVLIRGRLELNVDLGSGYRYDIIIRNAEVTKEE